MINIQLFGGGGGSSGGSYKGITKPPWDFKKNASYTWYRNGKKFQTRWYDRSGKPKKDKDYTDHGNSKKHPITPHYHDFIDSKHGKGYWIDKKGEKHYFED